MHTIGIIGSGIMGAGIAQVAATNGDRVYLLDVSGEVVAKAIDGIVKRLDRLVEKNTLTAEKKLEIVARLHAATGPADLKECDLIVEAVVERLEVKTEAFERLRPHVRADAIFASNTSSLSIAAMGQALGEGRRFVGMHFFNPVPLMPLVEVIHTPESDPRVADKVAEIAKGWGKTVVRAKDTPGFIVNRVARGFYLEALRILGEGLAGIDVIDRVMREMGGFRMGPFELMDTIGIDVNYSVSVSVWEQLGKPARLTPHPIQKDLFDKREFGRKSQRGFFDYSAEPPRIVVEVPRKEWSVPSDLREAAERFAMSAAVKAGNEFENYVFARILVTIINEAGLALDDGVASSGDIDIAMRKGTNYPKGPLEWAELVGKPTCVALLTALTRQPEGERFEAARSLR